MHANNLLVPCILKSLRIDGHLSTGQLNPTLSGTLLSDKCRNWCTWSIRANVEHTHCMTYLVYSIYLVN